MGEKMISISHVTSPNVAMPQGAVTLIGRLLVRGEECYLGTGESVSSSNAVVIDSPDLRQWLLDNVPCRLGGEFLYDEDAAVSGIVQYGSRDWRRITGVTAVEVLRESDGKPALRFLTPQTAPDS